ncbi:hypothetical protein [Candidatus Cyanaurora vandensis]|uniref:hypothetical protein n=1 Tax=Candidatus Cyanaurora vandensis TaxID=2714958 RepID=UPI00257D2992|nr:hypothetical protein [Candidatus Cyanaurora vandensis]
MAEFHREIKPLTGLEACQCRKERRQRNHIGGARLVWVGLNEVAYGTQTIYQLQPGLRSGWLMQQLKHPARPMALT